MSKDFQLKNINDLSNVNDILKDIFEHIFAEMLSSLQQSLILKLDDVSKEVSIHCFLFNITDFEFLLNI